MILLFICFQSDLVPKQLQKWTTPPRLNPNVNCGLWVTIMRQCRFINCNEYPTVVVVGCGVGCEYMGAGGIGNSTCLSVLLGT